MFGYVNWGASSLKPAKESWGPADTKSVYSEWEMQQYSWYLIQVKNCIQYYTITTNISIASNVTCLCWNLSLYFLTTSSTTKAILVAQFLQENSKDPSRGFGTSDLLNFVGVTDPNRIRCSTGSAFLGMEGKLDVWVGNLGRILLRKNGTFCWSYVGVCKGIASEWIFNMNELM